MHCIRIRKIALISTLGLVFSAVAADTPGDVDDLVGARASSGESALEERGYHHVSTSKGSDRAWSNWWNPGRKACLSVVTMGGRYDSIVGAPAVDCNQSPDDDNADAKAAAAVAAIAIIGAAALAHKSHDHDDGYHYEDTNRESEYERGYRDGMYNHSYDNYNRSGDYSDGYGDGVDKREHESSYRHHTNRSNTYGYTSTVQYSDLVGARASSADSGLGDRGFRNVDSFRSGSTAYTIWYNRGTRQCLQMATADGRADSIVDIHTHAACH